MLVQADKSEGLVITGLLSQLMLVNPEQPDSDGGEVIEALLDTFTESRFPQ